MRYLLIDQFISVQLCRYVCALIVVTKFEQLSTNQQHGFSAELLRSICIDHFLGNLLVYYMIRLGNVLYVWLV